MMGKKNNDFFKTYNSAILIVALNIPMLVYFRGILKCGSVEDEKTRTYRSLHLVDVREFGGGGGGGMGLSCRRKI